LGGKIVPAALVDRGWRVERHDDHFDQSTSDQEWITAIGKRKWIILTADSRIRYNPLEKAALLSSGTIIFVIAGRKNLTGRELANQFLSAEAAILKAIEKQRSAAIFKIHRQGRVELWLAARRPRRGRPRA
jgi:hypothetical protein